MLAASMDTNDFFTEAHPKLRPVESPTAGIFLSGVCQGPKDIPETVSQAGAAAAKVIGLLARDHLTEQEALERITAQHDESYYRERSWQVLENNGSIGDLKSQTSVLLAKLETMLEQR